ncbi:prion-inhibition and propagation-domain-containing protein [Cladorrhinum sp. PSN259]|nr:prion-inhibition and propagation-domain-containing protein [Cladorrhinum sp. PSN259]
MAEAVGAAASILTLLGLFKGCVDAFELIRAAKNQEKDFERLALALAMQQCRLKEWGRSMGLAEANDNSQISPRRKLLDQFEDRDLVQQALQQISDLLTDSAHMSRRYDGQQFEASIGDGPQPPLDFTFQTPPAVSKLTAAFKRFNAPSTKLDINTSEMGALKRKTFWVLRDRKKYTELVAEVRTLVDALEHVTKGLVSLEQQEELVISQINNINDIETLELITEICEVDHPALSSAASIRAEVISMATARREEICCWIDDAMATEQPILREVEAIESWDITKLREQYLTLYEQQLQQQLQQRENSKIFHGLSGNDEEFPSATERHYLNRTALPTANDEKKHVLEWFACPFYVSNPTKYQKVDSCGNSGWTCMDTLRQHLLHYHSEFYRCGRCRTFFDSTKELRAHNLNAYCQLSIAQGGDTIPEMMNMDQVANVRLVSADQSEKDQWAKIYKAIFPDDPVPASCKLFLLLFWLY